MTRRKKPNQEKELSTGERMEGELRARVGTEFEETIHAYIDACNVVRLANRHQPATANLLTLSFLIRESVQAYMAKHPPEKVA